MTLAPWNSPTANASGPAAATRSNAVAVKNVRRFSRTLPREGSAPTIAAIPSPMTRRRFPRAPSHATGRRLVGPEDEQRRLDPLAEDDDEGRGREGGSAADQRVVDTLLQLTLDARALSTRPEDHPRQHAHGEQAHGVLEQLRGPSLELRRGGEDEWREARDHRQPRAPPDEPPLIRPSS